MFTAKITITLRPAILDVQGKAVEHALHSLGYAGADHVRMGKYVTMNIATDDENEARRIAEDASKNLLSNPIIEDFAVALSRA